jgi:hypothetical protein
LKDNELKNNTFATNGMVSTMRPKTTPEAGRKDNVWLLNRQPHDVPVLLVAKLLKPLGNPPQNSVKFCCELEVLDQVKDRTWLAKVSNSLNLHWQKRNTAEKIRLTESIAGENG